MKASVLVLSSFLYTITASRCRCMPGQSCWPAISAWSSLNDSVSGQLIKNQPLAAFCYPESEIYDESRCKDIRDRWMAADLHLDHPTGYQYPTVVSCAPLASPGNRSCSLGHAPVYTINATNHDHVSTGILFAREYNLRLVIRNTGHDLLGRSAGTGSLQIWIRHLRNGIEYADSFIPLKKCNGIEQWNGASVTINGGYEWGDVYAEVLPRGKIVVGGATPTVGCIGGWMQGGGHSPASHDYGLGADQILEARVVLADGNLVTTNACHNPSLFRAIRGGGPAYGVVVSATWKVYPTRNVTAHSMTFAAKHDNETENFLEAMTDLYQETPRLLDHGYTGFGVWMMNGLGPLTDPPRNTPTYTHILTSFGTTRAKTEAVFEELKNNIQSRGLDLQYNIDEYPTYEVAMSSNPFTNSSQAAGVAMAYGSRLLNKKALTGDRVLMAKTVRQLAGPAGQLVTNGLLFVGGKAVFRDQPNTSILPAWRSTYIHALVSRMWGPDATQEEIDDVHDDITNVKVRALKVLAPEMGAYMNEADRFDEEWEKDFYGWRGYRKLQQIKAMYDPHDQFYCRTCVGSSRWREDEDGALCRV